MLNDVEGGLFNKSVKELGRKTSDSRQLELLGEAKKPETWSAASAFFPTGKESGLTLMPSRMWAQRRLVDEQGAFVGHSRDGLGAETDEAVLLKALQDIEKHLRDIREKKGPAPRDTGGLETSRISALTSTVTNSKHADAVLALPVVYKNRKGSGLVGKKNVETEAAPPQTAGSDKPGDVFADKNAGDDVEAGDKVHSDKGPKKRARSESGVPKDRHAKPNADLLEPEENYSIRFLPWLGLLSLEGTFQGGNVGSAGGDGADGGPSAEGSDQCVLEVMREGELHWRSWLLDPRDSRRVDVSGGVAHSAGGAFGDDIIGHYDRMGVPAAQHQEKRQGSEIDAKRLHYHEHFLLCVVFELLGYYEQVRLTGLAGVEVLGKGIHLHEGAHEVGSVQSPDCHHADTMSGVIDKPSGGVLSPASEKRTAEGLTSQCNAPL